MRIVFVAIVALLLAVACVAQQTCGTSVCPSSNLCCQNNLVGTTTNQCYNPSTHNCLPDQYVPTKNSLCPEGHYLGCNGVCYDSDLYICNANGQVRPGNGQIIIRSTTLWNDQSVINSLNSIQTSWVAGANPSFVGKTVGQLQVLAGTFLEPSESSVVARKISDTQNTCGNCPAGQSCCGTTCYNPSVHVCLDGFLCPVGHLRCGNACYRASQYGCFPGNFLCPVNHLPCGRACYRPDQYDCCNGALARPGSCTNGLPTNFNSATKWPNCINPIGNQGSCGSCWAFSATDVLGDRFCIHKHLASFLDLSAQYQVSCDTNNYGCDGGFLDLTWSFLANTGVPTAACVPYSGTDGTCPATCVNNSPITLNRATAVMQLDGSDIEAVQQEIFDNGPIQAAFAVYNDFFFYTSGVYKYASGAFAGGHAVRVVGWGVETGTNQPYWIVANSWGTGFGMSGFFWISRGNNEVGFESNLWRALPL